MRVLWRFLLKMRVLCGYIDLNTRICRSTCIFAGIVATLHLDCSTNLIIMSSQGHVPDLGGRMYRGWWTAAMWLGRPGTVTFEAAYWRGSTRQSRKAAALNFSADCESCDGGRAPAAPTSLLSWPSRPLTTSSLHPASES